MVATPSRYERTRCVRRGWAFERIGWVAMALVAIAGAVGLLGDGLLSRAETTAGDALTVAYPRYARAHARLEIAVDWLPRGREPTLWILRSYLDELAIEEIRPSPAAVTAGPDRIYYAFRTLDPEADGRMRVSFMLKPERGGAFRGRIGSEDELAVELRQFVFP